MRGSLDITVFLLSFTLILILINGFTCRPRRWSCEDINNNEHDNIIILYLFESINCIRALAGGRMR